MIIELIWLILAFFGVYFISQVTHELCHYLIAVKNKAKAKIEIWWWKRIPSMRVIIISGDAGDWFYFAGVFNSIVYIIGFAMFCYISMPIAVACQLIFWMQLFYGIYEGSAFSKGNVDIDAYMKFHYLIYISAILLGIFLMRNQIWNYLIGG